MGVKQEAAPPSLETDTGNTDKELKGRGRGIRRGESPHSEGSDKRNRRESGESIVSSRLALPPYGTCSERSHPPCHTWNQPGRDLKSGTTLKWCRRTRKQELDEALVDFIVKDSQPFTVVSDPGFCALVAKLDPTCTLPSRQTVKAMVERRDVEEKEKAKAALQNVDSVSLTADMWTSINMDAYLAVTCHAIHAGELSTSLVGVRPFPISHTAENIAGTA
ncbi:hypothetical protein D4764_0116120 [Takifugu flavidus]|uniref:HAT C-terminal dimerisation domain-containing protein n=1 Tax=Takifugu flavidus TaxID=433684 RepID=A0A5C6MI49_9TELE|nr:hypothetical protein D4764_0116120 [Takifugu flavidus]